MPALLIAAVLMFTPPTLERERPVMLTVNSVTEKSELVTDRGTVALAGLAVKQKTKTNKFLKEFLVGKLAKFEFEPDKKSAHLFVSSDCAVADKYLGQKSQEVEGQCVRSIYVNEILLKHKWATPAPRGVTKYRGRLFPEKK